MTEHRDHLFSLAVLAPADAVVHVPGREAQLFAQREGFVQCAGGLTAERCVLLGRALHAGNTHQRGKAFQQLVGVCADIGFAVHNKNLLKWVDYSSDNERCSTKWLFLYEMSPSRRIRLSSADSALRSTPR